MDPTTVVGNSGSPARNLRANFAVAAAAHAAVVTNSQADAYQWEHRKHSSMTHELELNEVAHAVVEGDEMMYYRQLIHGNFACAFYSERISYFSQNYREINSFT